VRQVLSRLLAVRPAEVELLRIRARVPVLSWALLACGLAATVVAALVVVPEVQRARHGRDEVRGEETLLARPDAPSGTKSPVARGSTDRELLAQGEAMRNALRLPWHALFERLEASRQPDVHLVSFSVEPRFSSALVVAESRDLEALLRYGQALSSAPPVRAVEMIHHEWRDSAGVRVVSATLVAHLRAGEGGGTP
jgi:hypothetical protein